MHSSRKAKCVAVSSAIASKSATCPILCAEISPKVGDAGSGGVLKLAQAVAELNPLDDLRQTVLAVEFAPFSLR